MGFCCYKTGTIEDCSNVGFMQNGAELLGVSYFYRNYKFIYQS